MAESKIAEQLVIHLTLNDYAQASWLVRGRDGAPLTQPQESSLHDIAVEAEGREVLVLIPGGKVLLLTADLPSMKITKLQQAVSYAVEDQLASDIDQLHFSVSAHRSEGGIDVAVINKHYFEHCLQQLKDAGLSPDFIFPETLALPAQDKAWHVYATPDRSLCRRASLCGFVADNPNLELLLSKKLNEVAHPEKIVLHNFNSNLDLDTLSSSLPVVIENIPCDKNNFFKEMARHVKTENAINLLQGAYRTETKITGVQKWQMVSAGLLGLWIFTSFSGLLFQHHVLSSKNDKLNQAIEKIYKKNFPEAQSVVAPKFRFQEKLKALGGVPGKSAYLHALSSSGNILKKFDKLYLNNLSFKSRVLSLDVSAPDFNYLNQVLSALKQQGLMAKQLNSHSDGKHVTAIFEVK